MGEKPKAGLQKLWYVRREGVARGPFPTKWIDRDIMLGRVSLDDHVSLDRESWIRVEELTEFFPAARKEPPPRPKGVEAAAWQKERQLAALRWMDERRLDRRQGRTPLAEEDNRRHEDRRQQPESADVLLARQRHAEWEADLKRRRDRFVGTALFLIALLALAVFAVTRLAPVNPIPVDIAHAVASCKATAAPQVNWSGCDKGGAWLRGVNLTSGVMEATRFNSANLSLSRLDFSKLVRADLKFADLTEASLGSANLQQADLSYAELRGADLRRADLRGATLEAASLQGARLERAIWVDGRICGDGSLGACR